MLPKIRLFIHTILAKPYSNMHTKEKQKSNLVNKCSMISSFSGLEQYMLSNAGQERLKGKSLLLLQNPIPQCITKKHYVTMFDWLANLSNNGLEGGALAVMLIFVDMLHAYLWSSQLCLVILILASPSPPQHYFVSKHGLFDLVILSLRTPQSAEQPPQHVS